MQERKQAVILFQNNEKFRNLQYDAGKAYLIQDIPQGFINKWISYGHLEVKDHEDMEVLKDVRSEEMIKSEYDAMVKREERIAEGKKKEIKDKKPEVEEKIVEEKVEEPSEEEVESIVEEEKVVEVEVVEEEQKKPSRGRKRK